MTQRRNLRFKQIKELAGGSSDDASDAYSFSEPLSPRAPVAAYGDRAHPASLPLPAARKPSSPQNPDAPRASRRPFPSSAPQAPRLPGEQVTAWPARDQKIPPNPSLPVRSQRASTLRSFSPTSFSFSFPSWSSRTRAPRPPSGPGPPLPLGGGGRQVAAPPGRPSSPKWW